MNKIKKYMQHLIRYCVQFIKKYKVVIIVTLAVLITLSTIRGCNNVEGTVALKINSNEAQVYIKNGRVHKGQKVALFDKLCVPKIACDENKIGEGNIARILNDHYFIITVAPGIPFDENTIVITK